MASNVVIIIPSQGADAGSFHSVARRLKREVYLDATIVKTTVAASGSSSTVTFKTLDGDTFSWNNVHHLSRVLTLSHGFSGDGPNLAYHESTLAEFAHQPWGSEGAELSAAGKSFWTSVGNSLRADGEIFLLGCFMGAGSYASNVAKLTGKTVYASSDLFGSGNAEAVLKYVQKLEAGRVPAPMHAFHR